LYSQGLYQQNVSEGGQQTMNLPLSKSIRFIGFSTLPHYLN
jgi:hypothetical protein